MIAVDSLLKDPNVLGKLRKLRNYKRSKLQLQVQLQLQLQLQHLHQEQLQLQSETKK